jgi:hypothetical protein
VDLYDRPQAPPVPLTATEVRRRCCGDCATRRGSPEREEEDGRHGQWHQLQRQAVEGRQAFICHRGNDGTPMRRRIAERHPDGREVAVVGDDYEPAASKVNGHPWFHLADGRPAPICAGWARLARKHGHDWFDRGELPPAGGSR